MEKVLISWSGGKDSAMSMWEIQKRGKYEIGALITTVTEDYDRISMHGVRRELLERQSEACGVLRSAGNHSKDFRFSKGVI